MANAVGTHEIARKTLQSAHLIHTGEPRYEGRIHRRENLPLRALAPFVTMREIQRGRSRAPVEQEVCMRRLDAAQVVEIGLFVPLCG